MPKLQCSATTCAYNCEELCCLNKIGVAGENAATSPNTCCSSFNEQSGATNSAENPNTELEVACEACNCTFNNDRTCCADHISIAGSNACHCEETECSSFKPE